MTKIFFTLGNRDKRIDSYIDRSAEFAKPVLIHLRELVHKACPDLQETIKWNFPHFDYKNEMMCSMASFKKHCAFGFWKASMMKDPNKIFNEVRKNAMGDFGKITNLKDLPSDKIIMKYINEAMRLNDEGVKVTKPKPVAMKDIKLPVYLTDALKKNEKAYQIFKGFSPSHVKEYVEWLADAKSEETRARRLSTAIGWLSEGKSRNWKYVKK